MAHNRRLSQFANVVGYDGGSIGIGTDNPNRLLHLKAASSTAYSGGSDTADYNFLKIENTTDDKSAGVFFLIGSNGEAAITATEVVDGNTDIAFQNRGGGVRSEKMRLDSSGRLLLGATSAILDNEHSKVQIQGSAGGTLVLGRDDSSVTAGNGIGLIRFYGNDDSGYQECARIEVSADGTHANNDKPTRMEFFTTADGGSSPTERLRINSNGDVLFKQEDSSSPYPEQQLKWSNDSTTANGFFISQDSDRNGKIFHQQGLDILFGTNNTERVRIDSSGRLLVNTSSSFNDGSTIQIAGSDHHLGLQYTGTSGHNETQIRWFDFRDQANAVICNSLQNDNTGTQAAHLIFKTADGGTLSERVRIRKDGRLLAPGVYAETTGGSANVNVQSDGLMQRSISSIKYKKDVETLEDNYADALLELRPVWYRSKCAGDNPDWGHWGFIAEELAEIDPRLVVWKTDEIGYNENGTVVKTSCDPEPEGVQYDRFVPHLVNLVKRQKTRIETLETQCADLLARVTALEG